LGGAADDPLATYGAWLQEARDRLATAQKDVQAGLATLIADLDAAQARLDETPAA